MLNINFEGKVRFYKLINFSIANNIDAIMISQGYLRVFRELTSFDGWYVLQNAIRNKGINYE